MFRNHVVDGVRIPAVTHWYYGICHLLPEDKVKLDRTKQFNASSDIELLEDVHRLGRLFIKSASALPFLPAKEFARGEKRFERTFARAQAQVDHFSPLYAAYVRLQDKVPQSIAGNIVAFSGE